VEFAPDIILASSILNHKAPRPLPLFHDTRVLGRKYLKSKKIVLFVSQNKKTLYYKKNKVKISSGIIVGL
jgi:hypothetical protein